MKILELIIDENDESGVEAVALVDSPAIQSEWMSFKKEEIEKAFKFKIQNEEKRIVSGYLMIADLPIVRMSDEGEIFHVVFRKNTIEKIVNKFMQKGLNGSINLMHDANQKAEGVYLIESLIIDDKRKVFAPEGFEKVSNGSWWGSMRVENDSIWEKIKSGEFRGFSVEGMFGQSVEIDIPDRVVEKIKKVVKRYKQNKISQKWLKTK